MKKTKKRPQFIKWVVIALLSLVIAGVAILATPGARETANDSVQNRNDIRFNLTRNNSPSGKEKGLYARIEGEKLVIDVIEAAATRGLHSAIYVEPGDIRLGTPTGDAKSLKINATLSVTDVAISGSEQPSARIEIDRRDLPSGLLIIEVKLDRVTGEMGRVASSESLTTQVDLGQ